MRGEYSLRGAQKRAPDDARIKQWITDLDSPAFAAREQAEKQLRSLAVQAESHLRKQLEAKPSLEVRRRIQSLLAIIEARGLTSAEIREVRAVQALQMLTKVAKRASGS